MVPVGVLARFDAQPGKEADVERFFTEGRPIPQQYRASTAWYAFRLSPTTFGVFDVFPDEESREANRANGAARVKEKDTGIAEETFTIQEFDVLGTRLPG